MKYLQQFAFKQSTSMGEYFSKQWNIQNATALLQYHCNSAINSECSKRQIPL